MYMICTLIHMPWHIPYLTMSCHTPAGLTCKAGEIGSMRRVSVGKVAENAEKIVACNGKIWKQIAPINGIKLTLIFYRDHEELTICSPYK